MSICRTWAASLFATASIVVAQAESRVGAADGGLGDRFGEGIATADGRLVAGAPGHDAAGFEAGACYVFERTPRWSEVQKLLASDAAGGDRFGTAAAAAGDLLVVGAPGSGGAGAVYVFQLVGGVWQEIEKLSAADAPAGGEFGAALAMRGNGSRIVVGAPGASAARGAVYVFDSSGSGFAQVAKLMASDQAPGNELGAAVVVRGNTVIGGAPGSASRAGATYVFERFSTVWRQLAKLQATAPAAGDELGSSLGIDATTVFAGAPGRLGGAGGVTVYARSGGSFTVSTELRASDAAAGDAFGASFALDGTQALIGAPGRDFGNGAAYRFAIDPVGMWSEQERWDGSNAGAFGSAVLMRADILAAAEPAAGADTGALSIRSDLAVPLVSPMLSTIAAQPDRIAAGQTTTITVTPMDDQGAMLGAGLAVQISASAGTLVGSVVDQGDGTYTQELQPDSTGGAMVSAVVEGVALNATPQVTFVPVDLTLSTITVADDEIEVGDQTQVAVQLLDAAGQPVTSTQTVTIAATAGTLVGAVAAQGNGLYTQTIEGTAIGTAEITATVDGFALQGSATLSVIDPVSTLNSVTGVGRDGTMTRFESIQQAVKMATRLDLETILVPPGQYDERVSIVCRHDLTIEGLVQAGPVTVRGFRIYQSHGVTIRNFEIDGTRGCSSAVRIHRSRDITLQNVYVHDSRRNGIEIGFYNARVTVDNCLVERSGRHGIALWYKGEGHVLRATTVRGNGRHGVKIGPKIEVTIEGCTITDNGFGHRRGGYGVKRVRWWRQRPERVTLLRNDVRDNNGRERRGRSDRNWGNYDLMFDDTDDQQR